MSWWTPASTSRAADDRVDPYPCPRGTAGAGRGQEPVLGLGLKQPSRLARAAFVFQPYPFGQALVQEDGNPSNPHTASNYIQRLLDSTY